jgi:glycosyltransferase involved in cell wall biosynthesis
LKGYLLFPELINDLKKDFPEIKACIIGKGEQEQAIKEKIKRYDLENNLELIGGLPHAEVFSYMQRSKIFLHTSSYEGQSTVIMEALANGLNIVCFDIGRADVKDRIWACKDKEEMARKLKELLLSALTHDPVILLTNEDMVRAFFKVYEI